MSEDPQVFVLTAVVYGSAPGDSADTRDFGPPRHVEAEFQARIPDVEFNKGPDGLTAWGTMYTHSLYVDLKHSHDWRCAYCGMSCLLLILKLAQGHVFR